MLKTKAPRTWLYAIVVSLAAALFVTVTGWLLASPSDEISNAISSAGTNVKQAGTETFIDALSSVLVTVNQEESASYVAAAVKLRPDLKNQIAVAAADVYSPTTGSDQADHRISRHHQRVPICCNCHTFYLPPEQAREFLQHHPDCRRGSCRDDKSCGPTPTPPPKFPICYHCRTIYLTKEDAHEFCKQHPDAYRGACDDDDDCSPTPTPKPKG